MEQNKSNSIETLETDLTIEKDVAFKDGKTFNGIAIQNVRCITSQIPEDGNWCEYTCYIPYHNGIKHGIYRANYKNNQVVFKVAYINGQRSGLFQEFFEDSQLKKEGIYERDKEEGVWRTWFNSGNLESINKYKKGTLTDKESWHNNHQLHSKYKFPEGLIVNRKEKIFSRTWFNDGQMSYEAKIIIQSNIKIYKRWNNSGQLSCETIVEPDGKQITMDRKFHDNGLIKEEKHHIWSSNQKDFMKKNGVFKVWDENGNLRSLKTYKDNMKEGDHKTWHPNNQLWSKRTYKKDNEHGTSQMFKSNGFLGSESKFKHGKNLVSKRMTEGTNFYTLETYSDNYSGRKIEYIDYDDVILTEDETPESYYTEHEELSLNDLIEGDEQMQDWYNSNENN